VHPPFFFFGADIPDETLPFFSTSNGEKTRCPLLSLFFLLFSASLACNHLNPFFQVLYRGQACPSFLSWCRLIMIRSFFFSPLPRAIEGAGGELFSFPLFFPQGVRLGLGDVRQLLVFFFSPPGWGSLHFRGAGFFFLFSPSSGNGSSLRYAGFFFFPFFSAVATAS